MMRWSIFLQKYTFDIEYLKGKLIYTDIVSRLGEKDVKVYSIKVNKNNLQDIHDKNKQKMILEFFHDISGHGKLNTMKYLICSRYIWIGVNKDINHYVRQCITCQRDTKKKVKSKHYWASNVSKENEKWQIDLIGPIKAWDEPYKYILNCVD
ncbi:hypothetical protein COBT_004091, partial [Conglomerata obtusa]